MAKGNIFSVKMQIIIKYFHMKVDNNNALCYNMNIVNIVYFFLKIVYLLSCKKPLKIPINGFLRGFFAFCVSFFRILRVRRHEMHGFIRDIKIVIKAL